MLRSSLGKKRIAGAIIGLALLAAFLVFNRFPKLDTVQEDLAVVNAPVVECFQGFCIETEPDTPFVQRWWDFSIEYIRLVAVGMTFAFLMAGLTEAFLFPKSEREPLSGGVWKHTLRGLAVGPVMTLCSACIAPVAASLWRRGAGVAGAIATVQGSATLNVPALVMVALVFSPMLGGSRVVVSLVAALLIGPLVALVVREHDRHGEDSPQLLDADTDERASWATVLKDGLRDWARLSLGYAVRLAPIMAAAAFASGLVIQWISPNTVSEFLGNDVSGVAVAATVGVLINVPLLFEIPLVALLLLLGMGEAPAAALLFTAAAGGPATFWALARFVPRRAIAAFAGATWAFGIVGGVAVLGVAALYPQLQGGLRQPDDGAQVRAERVVGADRLGVESPALSRSTPRVSSPSPPLAPFTPVALDLPGVSAAGVAVFDYDGDGDSDIFAAAAAGRETRLLRNDGGGQFADATAAARLASGTAGTAVAACDLDNDGYRDLYVGAPASAGTDRLLLNGGDGAFTDVTGAAFGDEANARGATSIGCADVDGDGLLDLYVSNGPTQATAGPHNALYLNSGDLTFDEVAEAAGVRGELPDVRGLDGQPARIDNSEPIGLTTAALFFDHDDDGDPDLWIASDGDRLRVYRNDSTPGRPRFTPVGRELGVDRVGEWTGMAVGDFDGDADLDVLVVNGGAYSLAGPPPDDPSGGCAYHARFSLGTCHHMLLRNDGDVGGTPRFVDVAGAISISRATGAAEEIEPVSVHPFWPSPTGLAAFPLGPGPAFLDFENDADQDLLWPSSGESANGQAGGVWRLLRAAGYAYETADADAPGDVGPTLALADLDGDGYTDVLAGDSAAYGIPAQALINGGGGNNWLRLRLVGRTALGESGSNADGVGARVYVVTRPDADAPPVVQVRDMRAGSGLGSDSGAGLDFGLAEATTASTVHVFWPSGRVQRLSGVAANQVLEIFEPPEE